MENNQAISPTSRMAFIKKGMPNEGQVFIADRVQDQPGSQEPWFQVEQNGRCFVVPLSSFDPRYFNDEVLGLPPLNLPASHL